VGGRVQLGEQVGLGIALDRDPQRGGAARALEVERLDRYRDHAELLLQRAHDRVVPGPGDVEVGGAAATVADREHLVRDEYSERGERDGHPDHDREQHVERSLLGEVEAGERGDDEQPGDDELAPLPRPSGRDQRVQAVTRMAVRKAIGTDGSADSSQGPRISTPSGRGRRSMSTARMLPIVATNIATAATSRCRQRRQITSTASVAHHRASMPNGAGFESTPAAGAVEVSQGVRIATNTLSTAWSATSTATATGRTLPTSTPAVDAAGAGGGWSPRAPASNGVEAVMTSPLAARQAPRGESLGAR
jgi:hypothetical protein